MSCTFTPRFEVSMHPSLLKGICSHIIEVSTCDNIAETDGSIDALLNEKPLNKETMW